MVTEVEGRYVVASNATLLGTTGAGDRVVYKPTTGVRPLWDFPADTLGLREVWTYRVSTVVAPGSVPETVIGDGVYGPGAVQRWIETDERFDPLLLVRRADPALWPLAVLDVVCNNADRKLGHILRLAQRGALIGIDHGLTFHPEDKLRTVLWSFAGLEVPARILARVAEMATVLEGEAGETLANELGGEALAAVQTRVADLLLGRRHPDPPHGRPALPWPLQ